MEDKKLQEAVPNAGKKELSIQDIKNIAFHDNIEDGILSIHIADLHKLFKP